MVVDHSCEKVVGSADRVEITCEVEVDVLHGNDLRISAACRAALDAEDRAEGGLTKSNHDFFAQFLEAVSQSDSRCGLALTCRGGVHRCHEDQLSVFPVGVLEKLVIDLGLVLAVLLKIFVIDPCLCRDLCDREHLTFLRNFNITLVAHVLIPFFSGVHYSKLKGQCR